MTLFRLDASFRVEGSHSRAITRIAAIVDQVVAARMQRPDGPGAPLL